MLFAISKNVLSFRCNNKPMELKYIGYEKEEEAIWTIWKIVNCEKPNAISIDNKLLYDYLKDQMNIVHCETGSFKESSRQVNPDSKITFTIN